MLIIGVDGAEYSIAKEYADVDLLENNCDSLHTVPSWGTIFDRLGREFDRPENYSEPVDANFIWEGVEGKWTIANLPITFPTFCLRAEMPTDVMKPSGEPQRKEERILLSKAIGKSTTEHTLVVINGIDAMSHWEDDMSVVHSVYEDTFRWVNAQDPDVILSDHGFDDFGGEGGADDHGPNGIVSGLDARTITEVGPELAVMTR